MSTISNERLDSIERQFIEDGFNDITDSEVVKLVSEVRALRKERERAVPVGYRKLFTCSSCGAEGLDEPLESRCHCNGDGARWLEGRLYTTPPAQPVAVPEIIGYLVTRGLSGMYFPARLKEKAEFDFYWWKDNCPEEEVDLVPLCDVRKLTAVAVPDDTRRMDWLVSKTVNVREPLVYGSKDLFWSQTITEEDNENHATTLREQIDAAMLAAPPAPTDKTKSEMSQMAEKLVRDTTALAVTLSSETDTTSQQFESLAGKAVVPAGWKLVPIELTKEMLKQIHPFAEATCLDCGNQVVAHCADNVTASWNDMLAVAPEPCK